MENGGARSRIDNNLINMDTPLDTSLEIYSNPYSESIQFTDSINIEDLIRLEIEQNMRLLISDIYIRKCIG